MPSSSHTPSAPFGVVAVVGVGLIGGSLAAALRHRGLAREVVGVGRDPARLARARELGQIDRFETALAEAARVADLIVVCTPVDRIECDVRAAAAACRPGTLLTDAGSVKQSICQPLDSGLPAGVEFVGSHPMAGGEQHGCEHARPDLFEGRRCAVTPTAQSAPAAVARISDFWRSVGAQVLVVSPAEHDHLVARSSHVPHLAAAALAATLPDEAFPLAATGFRDATRIASGDAGLWASILLQNADSVLQGLAALENQLAAFRHALQQRDPGGLRDLLDAGRMTRDRWLQVFEGLADRTPHDSSTEES